MDSCLTEAPPLALEPARAALLSLPGLPRVVGVTKLAEVAKVREPAEGGDAPDAPTAEAPPEAAELLVYLALVGDAWRGGVGRGEPELAAAWARADAWLEDMAPSTWDAVLQALASEVDALPPPRPPADEDDDSLVHLLLVRDRAASLMALALRTCARKRTVLADFLAQSGHTKGLALCEEALERWDALAGQSLSRAEAARWLGDRAAWPGGWLSALPEEPKEPEAPANDTGEPKDLLELALTFVRDGRCSHLCEELAEAAPDFADLLTELTVDLRRAGEPVSLVARQRERRVLLAQPRPEVDRGKNAGWLYGPALLAAASGGQLDRSTKGGGLRATYPLGALEPFHAEATLIVDATREDEPAVEVQVGSDPSYPLRRVDLGGATAHSPDDFGVWSVILHGLAASVAELTLTLEGQDGTSKTWTVPLEGGV